MPANKKYLSSPGQRWLKITAGFFGGYAVMLSLFAVLSLWVGRQNALVSGVFFGYILWAILLVLAFVAKSGWKVWGIYLGISGVLFTLFFIMKGGG